MPFNFSSPSFDIQTFSTKGVPGALRHAEAMVSKHRSRNSSIQLKHTKARLCGFEIIALQEVLQKKPKTAPF